MKIEVIGTGCPTCKQLYALTLRAAGRIGADVKVDYVTGQDGMKRLLELGLMSSPAITVNDKVVQIGYVPSIDTIYDRIVSAT